MCVGWYIIVVAASFSFCQSLAAASHRRRNWGAEGRWAWPHEIFHQLPQNEAALWLPLAELTLLRTLVEASSGDAGLAAWLLLLGRGSDEMPCLRGNEHSLLSESFEWLRLDEASDSLLDLRLTPCLKRLERPKEPLPPFLLLLFSGLLPPECKGMRLGFLFLLEADGDGSSWGEAFLLLLCRLGGSGGRCSGGGGGGGSGDSTGACAITCSSGATSLLGGAARTRVALSLALVEREWWRSKTRTRALVPSNSMLRSSN